jgi:hypothetical protein
MFCVKLGAGLFPIAGFHRIRGKSRPSRMTTSAALDTICDVECESAPTETSPMLHYCFNGH